MSFYEYKCQECGEITELRLSPKGHIPQSVECVCGSWARRVWGGHQINMNYRVAAMQAFDKLPEHAKTGNTEFLKNESRR